MSDRRSIAVIPGGEQGLGFSVNSPDDFGPPPPNLTQGLGRSQTVLRREGAGAGRSSGSHPAVYEQPGTPSPVWSPDFAQLPTPSETHEIYGFEPPMSSSQHSISGGKTSSDSGQHTALDRWSQRRLQRLNTEQGFREQRQGGQGVLSPPLPGSESSGYNSAGASYPVQDTQPQPPLHQQPQPHPAAQQAPSQSSRTAQASNPNAGLAVQAQQVSRYFLQHHPPLLPAISPSTL